MSPARCFALVILLGVVATSSGAEVTPEQARAVQAKFRAERETAAKQFPVSMLARADRLAARAEQALENNQPRDAMLGFREARWLLPVVPAELPANVSRVYSAPRLRHGDIIYSLSYSSDGQRLATASKDGTVKIWDLSNGRELLSYRGHGGPVRAVVFAPNDKFIVSAGGTEVHVWNPDDGKLIRKFTAHTKTINAVAVRPDSKRIASGGDDLSVRIWDPDADKPVLEITGTPQDAAPVMSLAYSPNGKLLAWIESGGTSAGVLKVQELEAEAVRRVRFNSHVHQAGGYQIAYSPDGKWIATVGERRARVLTAPNQDGPNDNAVGTQQREYTGHGGLASAVAFSKDGRFLATGSADNVVRVWDTSASDKLVRTFHGHDHQITALAFSPDGEYLASASMDQNVRLWTMQPSDPHRNFAGHTGPVWSAALRKDGQQIASGGADRAVILWDVNTGKVQHRLEGHRLPVTTVLYSPDGRQVLSCGGDKLIKLWDAATGQFVRDLAGHDAAVLAAGFSANGTRIVSGGADRLVKVWDEGAKEARTLTGHRAAVSAVAVRPDGKLAATGSADGMVILWDLEKFQQTANFQAHAEGVASLSFSTDGRQLASGGTDRKIKIWQVPLGKDDKPLMELSGHSAPVSSVAISPDGRFGASGGGDHLVKIWSLQTRAEIRSLRGHTDWVSSVAFSADSRQLVSASVDHSVKLWDFQNEEASASLGHTRGLRIIAVSPDGKLFATGGDDRTIKIWETDTGLEKLTLAGHGEEIQSLAFLPGTKLVVSGAKDSKVKIWDLDAGREIKSIDNVDRVPTLLGLPGGKGFVAWLLSVKGENESVSTLQTFDANGEVQKSHPDRGRNVTCLAFSADGAMAATGDTTGSVRVFNAATGERVSKGDLPAHVKSLGDVALTPDKKTLITGDEDGEVKVWDFAGRETLYTITAHKTGLMGIAVSHDGARFATMGRDGSVKLWNVKEGTQLREWDLRVPGRSFAFVPGGKHLLVANADASVYVLDLP
jgi:WD40 repeat protein